MYTKDQVVVDILYSSLKLHIKNDMKDYDLENGWWIFALKIFDIYITYDLIFFNLVTISLIQNISL